jgi:NifU-like protein involved in Fe-S cluster formation
MTTDPYGPRVREYFAAPAHAGELDGAQAVLVDGREVRLQLAATAAGGRIEAMRFRVWGCPHTIAAAEAACAALEGRPVAELLEFSAADLINNLPVPVEKTGRILVLEDTVRSLGHKFGDGP